MIIKQKNGTVLEMTPEEFAELGGVLDDVEEATEGIAEVATEFKVGDTVKVVGVTYLGESRYSGEIGVIKKVYDDGDVRVHIVGDGLGIYPPSSLKLIEEEPEEVLSRDNVKVGEYLVITDKNNGSQFAIGGIIKAVAYYSSVAFTASNTDNTEHWNVRYTDVRRATAEEIAEATKPKEVKFEIGDAISVNGRFAFILRELSSKQEYAIQWYSDGESELAYKSDIRHATDEEKSHLQTLIGRKKDEYTVGDLVELLSGANSGYSGRNGYIFEIDKLDESSMPIHLKDNGNKTVTNLNTWSRAANLKLITPVEWRHDFI